MSRNLTFINSFGSNLKLYFAYYNTNADIVQTDTTSLSSSQTYTQIAQYSNYLELIYLDTSNNYGIFQILTLTNSPLNCVLNLTKNPATQPNVIVTSNVIVNVLSNNINNYVSTTQKSGWVQIGNASDNIWVDNKNLKIYLQNKKPTSTVTKWAVVIIFCITVLFAVILISGSIGYLLGSRGYTECLLNSKDEYWEEYVKKREPTLWKQIVKGDREKYMYGYNSENEE